MKKPTSKKPLAVSTHTVRPLQGTDLAQVNGGSISVQNPILIFHTSVISYNPSGG